MAKHSKSILTLLLVFVLQFFLISPANGAPTLDARTPLICASSDQAARSLDKRYYADKVKGIDSTKNDAAANPNSDYPSDEDIMNSCNPSGPLVFWSQVPDGSSKAPFSFAQSIGGSILRDAFPKGYLNRKYNGVTRSQAWHQNFLDRASGIFADKASGEVYLVSNYALDGNVNECRIWARVEFPSIQATEATKVTLVDALDFSNTKTLWVPDNGNTGCRRDSAIFVRDDNILACPDWNDYGDDPGDPDETDTTPSYQPSNCGLHFVQYQKNEGPGDDTSQYRYDLTILDANGMTIGSQSLIEGGGSVGSALPYTVTISSGATDDDPVSFAYGSDSWDTSNSGYHECSVGVYDSGSRQGDCGFTCN